MDSTSLEKATVETLAYFSLFSYPLTTEELFRYLWKSPAISYAEYHSWLLAYRGDQFASSCAFFYLRGKEKDILHRQTAVVPTEQKMRRAQWAMRFIRWIPFLKAVFLCNSVAMNVATAESDVDVFIVTENNRTWLVRFFTTITLSLVGLRRHGKKITNRLCLSFYSDVAHLAMERVTIAPDDVYLAYWLTQLFPLHDPENIKSRILEVNSWMRELVPNSVNSKQKTENRNYSAFERVLRGRIGDWLEQLVKKIQLRHIKKTSDGKERTVSTAVVIEDGFLKFHETDRREEIRGKWYSVIARRNDEAIPSISEPT